MDRNQKGFGFVEGLLILVIVGMIGLAGWYVYHIKNTLDRASNKVGNTSHQQTNHPKTILELRQKYESKQTSWTAQDTKNCLEDYYRIAPSAKSPKPGVVTLAPPCPGVPQ